MTVAKRRFRLRDVVGFLVYVLLAPLVLFLTAGRWNWWQAWAYILVTYSAIFGSRWIVLRRNPEMLIERARSIEDPTVKPWDRVLAPLIALIGPALIMLTSGLDERFNWSPDFSLAIQLLGLAGIVAGSAFSTWAMIENQFFSAQVRIQKERGQYVVTTGPYSVVRHPGYAGGLLLTLSTPLLLGSLWAYIPSAVTAWVYFTRTKLEDQTLQAELPGYSKYAARTHFRLIPGIW